MYIQICILISLCIHMKIHIHAQKRTYKYAYAAVVGPGRGPNQGDHVVYGSTSPNHSDFQVCKRIEINK